MKQSFKSVYFRDVAATQGGGVGLTLAFGKDDAELLGIVRPMSSEDLRRLLGSQSLVVLRRRASEDGLPLNAWCLRRLRKSLRTRAGNPRGSGAESEDLNPIHATFRGGQSEPLHLWYPLLEGYSPEFVRAIHRTFAPAASRVLDPFAGSGTTPLTAARMGLLGFYCELNPLLQFLTATKIDVLTMEGSRRLELLDVLAAQVEVIPAWLQDGPQDRQLPRDYEVAFGRSRFYDDDRFAEVLRARSLVDHVHAIDPSCGAVVAVAVLANLLHASRLTRAGDVRFRRPEELRVAQSTLADMVVVSIRRMMADIASLEYAPSKPTLVCEDARFLARVPELDCDCVITSPPYLNGTNYFRNTKVELWFLRCLGDPTALAWFRRRAVTAGINDVTRSKVDYADHPAVRGTMRRLKNKAYDPRIPKMVASYFRDMADVFVGLKKHLRGGAAVAIDIGDSSYGGVHVPTDRILTELLCEQGLVREYEVVLRRRKSRDQTELKQLLLVFSSPSGTARQRRTRSRSTSQVHWWHPWLQFKANLPHQKHPFAKRNWGHPLHSLCSYQGKMKPSLAHHLAEVFLDPGGRVLDPFAGVGTIPFEAQLRKCHTYGFEISPAALSIASAKCGRPDDDECEVVLALLESWLATASATHEERETAGRMGFNGRLPQFFHRRTFDEILLARRFFLEHPPVTASEFLVHASLLHILHGNRPYALSRRSHNATPFSPTGPFEYRALMPRLRAKVARSLANPLPADSGTGRMYFQDATAWWPPEVDRLDAVLTSPPFFDSTRFHLANWLRLWFCGWEEEDFHTRPRAFVDERQKTGFSVYAHVFRQARERLNMGGVVAVHLGKSRKCDMAKEIAEVAAPWFRTVDVFTEDVTHCEHHGVRDKGTVSAHQYLVLQ